MNPEWKAICWTCHAATTVVVDDGSIVTGKRVIAECRTEEHARLIAAAPDLLDALISLKEAVEYTPLGGRGIKAVVAARAAIDKATGGRP